MPDAILVYLHGFLSSPRSIKAQQLVRFIADHRLSIECAVPALPEEPHLALEVAEQTIALAREKASIIGVLGSSLGGFYATVTAERHGLRAVLINPSVRPHLRMEDYISAADGDLVNPYTDRRFSLGKRDVDVLRAALRPRLARPKNYWLLAQMGDEVLDYREAVDYYAGAEQTIEAGGDHSFQGFERHLPEIVKFLQLPPN